LTPLFLTTSPFFDDPYLSVRNDRVRMSVSFSNSYGSAV
jgi:hypothetical protein